MFKGFPLKKSDQSKTFSCYYVRVFHKNGHIDDDIRFVGSFARAKTVCDELASRPCYLCNADCDTQMFELNLDSKSNSGDDVTKWVWFQGYYGHDFAPKSVMYDTYYYEGFVNQCITKIYAVPCVHCGRIHP